jgi:hypothetical protein
MTTLTNNRSARRLPATYAASQRLVAISKLNGHLLGAELLDR